MLFYASKSSRFVFYLTKYTAFDSPSWDFYYIFLLLKYFLNRNFRFWERERIIFSRIPMRMFIRNCRSLNKLNAVRNDRFTWKSFGKLFAWSLLRRIVYIYSAAHVVGKHVGELIVCVGPSMYPTIHNKDLVRNEFPRRKNFRTNKNCCELFGREAYCVDGLTKCPYMSFFSHFLLIILPSPSFLLHFSSFYFFYWWGFCYLLSL